MERFHRFGMPAMILAVWVLSAWTALSVVGRPVMYGAPVSISAPALHHGAPERGQASRATR